MFAFLNVFDYLEPMSKSPPDFNGFHTRAIHAGARPDPTTGSRAMPIHQTTSYVFGSADEAAAYFNLQEYGNTYSRIMNPTVAALEERIANLEGGVGAVAFASGLAAQHAAMFTLLEPGNHVVASAALYGGSTTQLKHVLRKMNVGLSFVDPHSLTAWEQAITPDTRLLFGETIGNPSGTVLDISAVADIAHRHEVPLMIDNTFATPFLCRPLEYGADIVVHSATKFIGGHGTSLGGIVVESGEFDWSCGNFDVIAKPSPAYHGLEFHATFGTYGYLMKLRAETLRDLGSAMSPFNAFLIAQGVETLPLRMRQHVANARKVAEFLQSRPEVSAVHYPESSQPAELVKRYLPQGTGSVFCFDLKDGRSAGLQVIEHLSLFSHLANVGDAKSLVIHPASTTHRQLSDSELASSGIQPGTVRVSIGIEDADDLIADLSFALDQLANQNEQENTP